MAAEIAAKAAISTLAELRQRISQRASPAAEKHHTIGGTIETATHREEARSSEARIAELRSNLGRAAVKAETDHAFASQKGRPSAHFNRER